jgi:hypothetical protein
MVLLLPCRDGDVFASQALQKKYSSRSLGEESIVLAPSDIRSRMKLGSPLANEDLSRLYVLTAEPLHAKPFGLGITTVFGASAPFLMCHISSSFQIDDLYEEISTAQ